MNYAFVFQLVGSLTIGGLVGGPGGRTDGGGPDMCMAGSGGGPSPNSAIKDMYWKIS